MKNIKHLLFASVWIFILTGCNDDFLNKLPETEIGKEKFFNSTEDLSMYINNLYNFEGSGIYNNDRATDNATTTGETDIKTIMTTNATSNTITGGWDWSELRAINFFLDNFKKAAITKEQMNHFEGLARFFRARFYMKKVQRFSDVPWYDKALTTADNELLFKKRDSRDFVIKKIFEDYRFAAEHVMEDQVAGAVNKWVVLTYMARHALYEGTFRKYHPELHLQNTANVYLKMAQDASASVMKSGKFSIYNTGNVSSDYYTLFASPDLTANKEIILANIAIANLKNSNFSPTIFGNYEVSPSRDLVQSYLMKDGSYYSSQSNIDTKPFVDEFKDRDPRLTQTYCYPGWELIARSTYSQGVQNYVQQLQKNFSGYHQIKGFINNISQEYVNGIDVPVLRYAEVLLTYAESKTELGTVTQGDLDETINTLRDRAGMPHLTLNPMVDPLQQKRYPKVSNPLLLEVRRERRVEFALEGYRKDDIYRWGAGKLLEKEPEGLYFPSLGKYDLTGDGHEDIMLIGANESIPTNKEKNSLGVTLVYYKAGTLGESVNVFLKNGTSGTIVTVAERGTFISPKHYYRPIPANDVAVNPNLTQIFDWK